ncbi:chorismate lyase [Chitinimonas arctica]|uniref:Probable chorismate pyruvate-lyase n=1 Tax=Chitinimonas arctica TaxID=2594795 RepID=A0A516S9Q0_9NEIS|nr:chorismate lyase [Chitinimonas arctica]QDQ24882.1 chorismate lyase [Chitinimonas arctica]
MPHIASHRWVHPASRAPRAVQTWLTHPGSLTARLIARFPRFRVRLLRQQWGRPNRDELGALRLERSQLALVREVVLMSGDTPLVFAHSVMPRQALMHGYHRLRRQGVKPLGATLFANPKVKRSRLAFRGIDRRHTLYRRAEAAVGPLPPRLWARRSCFELGRARILVTEVFLPATLT